MNRHNFRKEYNYLPNEFKTMPRLELFRRKNMTKSLIDLKSSSNKLKMSIIGKSFGNRNNLLRSKEEESNKRNL
jgi:hypothetical protein